jgi:DNA-binding SARP family transcriptional activator
MAWRWGRDRLCGLLWAEAAEEQARASLRQCVKLIRQALGADLEPVLQAERLNLMLDRAAIDVDVARVLDRLATAICPTPTCCAPNCTWAAAGVRRAGPGV